MKKQQEKQENQIVVERAGFMAWTEGVLLDFHDGNGICVNELECEAAEKALKKGKTILFKNGPNLTGTAIKFSKKDKAYVEFKL